MLYFARVVVVFIPKATDVSADLVGKVKPGIPEDDPRNPATIADNVGDNVGDVAGMGSRFIWLFMYVATVLATMVLGRETLSVDNYGGFRSILLPMLIAGTGIVFSIIGTFFVKISDKTEDTTAKFKSIKHGGTGEVLF